MGSILFTNLAIISALRLDVEFLNFFYKRLERNDTENYNEEFPFLSRCGRELNFIRCDDTPVVYTKLFPTNSTPDTTQISLEQLFSTSAEPFELHFGGNLTVDFEPELLEMTGSGRLYYPTPPLYSQLQDEMPLTLVASPLALALGQRLRFGDDVTILDWQGDEVEVKIRLDDED